MKNRGVIMTTGGAALRALGFALVLTAAGLASAANARQVELSDYYRLQSANNPQISPDGSRIIYNRGHWNPDKDAYQSDVWIMDRNGANDRFLMHGSGLKWSPNGDRLAYVAPENGHVQIFIRQMNGQQKATAITHGTLSPSDLQWSPDGKSIAFTASVAVPLTYTVTPPADLAGIKWNTLPAVIDTVHYRDMTGEFIHTVDQLFVVSVDDGLPRQVTHGDWNVGARWSNAPWGGPVRWTPDGRSLVFDGFRGKDTLTNSLRSDINIVDVASGRMRTLTTTPGFWFLPVVSPDGKWIAFDGHRDLVSSYPEVELHLMRIDGGDDRVLLKDPPDEIHRMEWAPDSRGVYWSVNEKGSVNIHYTDLAGHTRQVTTGNQVLGFAGVTRDGWTVATRGAADATGDIVAINLKTGAQTQLTHVNAELLKTIDLAPMEEMWFKSADGTPIQGWLIKPAHFDPAKKYALILNIHGGPHDMAKWSMDFRYQAFAAQGYVVLITNPRGSTGYGAKFANAIDNAFPGDRDYSDLMAGVDAAIARGFIDTNRLYVMGCSGGGALTAWIVGHTHRFAAAAVLCPMIDWISFAGSTDVTAYGYTQFRVPFWKDPKLWLEHSPLMYAGHVTTPTMLIVGDHDFRTPYSQSEEFYRALKVRGVDTKLIVVPGESHAPWTGKPSDLFQIQLFIEKWFAEHSGAPTPIPEGSTK
ncbi:MAG: S9 family peptidase [Rhodanobacter sp.]